MNRRATLCRLMAFSGLLLLMALPACSKASPKGAFILPSGDDPRFALLNSTTIAPFHFKDISINDFSDEIKLTQKLKCSVVLRGQVEELRFSLDFRGGTLKELLEQTVQVVPISIRFDQIAVVIDKAGK